MRYILFFLLLVTSCTTDRGKFLQDSKFCDNAYETSELYFKSNAQLVMRLRYVYFSEKEGNVNRYNFDSITDMINEFYSQADIRFVSYEVEEIVDNSIREDMPSYVKYHIKQFAKDSVITCYIYGDYQPNYSNDKKSITGSAGGIGSVFFCVKESYLKTNTILHELGHCLGLYHIDSPDESPDGYNIQTGDKVCDTPKASGLENQVNLDCKYTGTHPYLEDEKKILTCNIMSYVYHKCRNCFTDGQVDKIRWTIHESGDLRNTIVEGFNKEIL